MKAKIALAAAFAFFVAGAQAAQVNSNNMPLNNGTEIIYIFSSPSSGASTGTEPPDLDGDLFWKSYPGDRVLCHFTDALGFQMEIDGYYEGLFDTDWNTSPSFYDRSHGPATDNGVNPGNYEPLFFTAGWTTEQFVSLGPSGLPNPCVSAPSLCSPPGGTCPPSGTINGYLVDIHFSSTPGTGILIPADGTSASDMATTYFLPGGMTATGGTCGSGDYVLQDLASQNESQEDDLGGTSAFSGFQVGRAPIKSEDSPTGPVPDPYVEAPQANITFREPILNVVGVPDEFTVPDDLPVPCGSGPTSMEAPYNSSALPPRNGGGGLAGLKLSTSSGFALLGGEIRDFVSAGTPNIAIIGFSRTPLPSPIPVLGGHLKVNPDGVFNSTSSVMSGMVMPCVFTFTSEGAFQSVLVPVPMVPFPLDLYGQGFVFDLSAFLGSTTNRVRVTLYP